MNEEVKKVEEKKEDVKKEEGKKKLINEGKLEVLVAIFLGITALLMAWATWIGSLHGGNQATNYTKSNNLASEGNAEYNSAAQLYLSDLVAWNSIVSYEFDIEIARANGNTTQANLIEEKLDKFIEDNCTDQLAEAIKWANEQEGDVSPFSKEGFVDSYFTKANELLDESQKLLEEGQKDNAHGDAFGLVSVIYSVVLFLLGIIGVFKKLPNRKIVFVFSIIALIVSTVYMFRLPMPTGFDFSSFFKV